MKKSTDRSAMGDDRDPQKTQELFRCVQRILNQLKSPHMYNELMAQVKALPISTKERLEGVVELIFEKALSDPQHSETYAQMCRCLMGLKTPATDKAETSVNFRKLLLNRCQKEFEKVKDDDEIFEKKQKELEAASSGEERRRLKEELQEAKSKEHKRSMGNMKFIGELFKLKMLTEVIMHDCIVKLLKNQDEESLECLCRLLSIIGKDLDFEKAKPRMDQYFDLMNQLVKKHTTSSRVRLLLEDVLELRRNNWVAKRTEPHTSAQGAPPQNKGPNTVPTFTKNRPIHTSRPGKNIK